ncbi:MAG: type VI secretion system TssO [Bacteroidetes bacterium]|nr:type VI secretion system TssO [Bacteroidota bacterium]
MTKDLKNKFTTFIILLFASVLLLIISLYSDYSRKSSKQMDNDALKIAEMEAITSKQTAIIIQMDTIERKLTAFKPTADDAVVLSNEIEKGIKDLKSYFEKNELKESAFVGIIDNYNLMLADKKNIKNTVDNNNLIIKKLDDCKERLKSNNTDLKQLNLFQGMTNKNTN